MVAALAMAEAPYEEANRSTEAATTPTFALEDLNIPLPFSYLPSR
jgi:hypothetical protein